MRPPSHAPQYMADAMREFEGTSEEVRVTVADSELAIARGDVEGALKKVGPTGALQSLPCSRAQSSSTPWGCGGRGISRALCRACRDCIQGLHAPPAARKELPLSHYSSSSISLWGSGGCA